MKIFIIIILFFASISLSSKEYTFSMLREAGVKNSSELLIKQNSVSWQLYETKRKLRDLYLPTTTLEARSSRVTNKEGPFVGGTKERSKSYSTKLSLNYNIFNGFEDFYSLQRERAILAKSRFRQSKARADLIFEISKRYHEAVKEIGYKEIIDQELLRSQKLLSSAKIRYKRGVISKSDLYRSEIELLEAKENLISQKSRISSLAKEVQNLIEEEESLTIVPGESGSRLSQSTIKRVEDYKSVGFDEIKKKLYEEYIVSDEYKLIKTELKVNCSEKAIIGSEFLPKLNFNLSHNYMFGDSLSRFGINRQDYTAVGFTLTIPLFNSFDSSISYSQAALNLESSRHELRKEAVGAKIKIEKLVRSLIEKYESYKIQAKKLGFQEKIYNKSFNRYKLGAITTKELIDDKVELTRTAYKLADASYQIRVTGLELDYLVGRL